MSLTRGRGPLATDAGEFNFDVDAPKHRIFFEDYPRRVRAIIGDRVVLDTERGKLLHESNILPVFYFPIADLDRDVLADSDHTTHCPFKGDASYWHVQVGDRTVENAIWRYEQPLVAASWLGGHAALYEHLADTWLIEDDPVYGHLRDPYHRVDVLNSSRAVTVRAGDETIATTQRPKLLFETGLPRRAYIPRADVAPGVLEPSEKQTVCPYKGQASHWHVRTASGLLENAAWSYEAPLAEAAGVTGHLCFDLGDAEVTVA